MLPVGELSTQRGECPFDQVAVQIGHHADGVRQIDAVLEGGTALVIDEHEAHRVRSVRHRERGHQALEELGLARAGGAGHQTVWSVGDQVKRERTVQRDPEQRLRAPAGQCPATDQRGRVGIREGEDVQQPGGWWQSGVVLRLADVPQRRQGAADPVKPARVDLVGPDPGDVGGPLLAQRGLPARPAQDDRGAFLRESPLVRADAQAVHTDRGAVL